MFFRTRMRTILRRRFDRSTRSTAMLQTSRSMREHSENKQQNSCATFQRVELVRDRTVRLDITNRQCLFFSIKRSDFPRDCRDILAAFGRSREFGNQEGRRSQSKLERKRRCVAQEGERRDDEEAQHQSNLKQIKDLILF